MNLLSFHGVFHILVPQIEPDLLQKWEVLHSLNP